MSLENMELIKTIISYALPILGVVMLTIWFVYLMNDFHGDLTNKTFAVSFLLFTACLAAYLLVCMTIREKEIEKYNTCVSNDYEVYLNGSKVELPDKLNVKSYDITFDDDKKEVILSD